MKPLVILRSLVLILTTTLLITACQAPLGPTSDLNSSRAAVVLVDPVPVTSFVSVNGGKFMADGKPFYFAGTNNYYFMYKSNFMIDWVLYDAGRMGVKVIRSWAFMDGASHDGYALQPSLGVYADSGLERLDYAIAQGKKAGIRFVLALTNYWSDFGGMPQYLTWLGLGSDVDKFYTDSRAWTAYKNYASHILNHVNRYTGVAYKDEPAIMAWNLTNEARNPSDSTGAHVTAWAKEMSDYIHGIAPKQLISLGDEGFYNIYNDAARGITTISNNDTRKGHQEYNGGGGVDFNAVLELPNIHYGVMHNYAQDWWSKDEAWSLAWVRAHLADGKRVNKPIVLEEFSRKSVTDSVRSASMKLQTDIMETEGGAGTMSWMLVSKMDSGVLYRDMWDDGFQIAFGDITADMLTQHAITMWAKNGTGTSPCVNFPPPPPPEPTFPVAIDTFEAASSDSSLASSWVRNGSGNSISPKLLAAIASTGSKSMGLDWTLGTPSYAGVQHALSGPAANWTGADGIRFTYNADTATNGRNLTLQCKESNGEYWEANVTLTSGASRQVFVPWSSFAHPGWYSGGNNTKDLGSMSEFSLYMGGSAGTGRLIIDDLGADKGSPVPIENSTLNTASVSYTPGSATDIAVGITFKGNTLSSIRKEGAQLVNGTDYTVNTSGVVLKSSYLETLTPSATSTLAFFFSAGTSPNLSVVVGARQVSDAKLNTTSLAYTPGSLADQSASITWNGNSLKALKAGNTTLVAGSNYTVSTTGVTLKASWLETLSPSSSLSLSFDFASGTDASATLSIAARPINNAVLGSTSGSYTKASASDIAIAVDFKGNSLSKITNGSATLVAGTDYTVSTSAVTLKASYLEGRAIGTYTLGFTFSAGAASSYTLTVKAADNPTGKITVQYNNANSAASTNQAKPELKILNTGTSAVALKDLKVRYWFTNETGATMQATIWWANRAQSSLVATIGSNYVELSWPTSTESLAAGEYVQIHMGLNANNWSNFSQSNDYSFVAGTTSFVANNKITARLAGVLAWGIEP